MAAVVKNVTLESVVPFGGRPSGSVATLKGDLKLPGGRELVVGVKGMGEPSNTLIDNVEGALRG